MTSTCPPQRHVVHSPRARPRRRAHDEGMPKKRRRRRSRPRTSPDVRSREHSAYRDIDLLLDEFVMCRATVVSPVRAVIEADHVKPLLILRRGESEDPALLRWTEEQIRHLLLDLVPRHQWQPRELLLEQIPALGEFFVFLVAHGYWHRENMALAEARALLSDLTLPALEIVEDPSRPSEPENILAYAVSLGIETRDADAFAQFIEWYNGELTRDEKREISETGRCEGTPWR